MALTFPASPVPRNFELMPSANFTDLSGPAGGVTVRRAGLGDRFAFSVDIPPIKYVDLMRYGWLSFAVKAFSDTVVMNVRQPGFNPGNPGAPLVNGASLTGSSLPVDGLTAGYPAKDGQMLSIVGTSRRYLYMITADTRADAAGAATLPVWPPLRGTFPDNAVVELFQPKIEGMVEGDSRSFSVERLKAMGAQFTIREVE